MEHDLDLRLVRYFTVVAEHRHFGRAAESLRIAQPSLSRQIRRLEECVGARLLDRTPRGTELTEAGTAFLPLATALLSDAKAAAARARSVAEPRIITIGFTAGISVTPAVSALRRRHPHAEVRTTFLAWHEPREALLEHRVDAAVARLPFATDRLQVTVLYDEPRVLLVPLDHCLAGKEMVTLDDIVNEPIPRHHNEEWDAFWRIDPRPDGRRAPEGPLAESIEDKLELVAGGQAVGILPAGAAATYIREDVTTVPLDGVEPCHVVLATRAKDRGELVSAFGVAARGHLRR
ncbi:LysR substrate-binding domain-containing protein [Allokutzneria sp. A3M-2-11 16]|uniref:LysR family transcriptional regulator n=1 Tax=Allokutzneria sp. A3M-2-11 16 TaxID=2962043 RepID=UPI0020B7838F|nr:LysR substrate-binding domain-containing protein [Allokutzneria sp. A3M-2-11 16]MCP3802914.1 LysR substrate-binding domain-containing protein [Allokutzneria sp. A3M-2-11 16]